MARGIVKEFTNVDLVANVIYIYLMLIFFYIVIGVIFYAVREYYISFKERPPSITDAKIDNWIDSKEKSPIDLENLGSLNRNLSPDGDNSIAKSTKLGIRKVSQISVELDSQLIKKIDDFKKIEIIYDEINSGEVQSVNKYLYRDDHRFTYNLEDLNDIKESVQELPWSNKVIKMSEILRLLFIIPKIELSTYENNRLIKSIELDLIGKDTDITTKSLALLKLIALGVNESNTVLFMHSFNELVEFMIDTGLVFRIIEATPVANLRLLTIEMLLNYCYQHWNFKHRIDDKSLSIQSRITIFRLLCNIKLEVTLIESLQSEMLRKIEFKIQSTIREVIKKNYCNDYLEFIPMISQAVSISQTHSVKYLFYDVLYLIISQHHDCCMKDYLRDDNTDLKYLMQHGFWNEHNEKLIRKVAEIHEFLMSRGFGNTQSWHNETNGGKKFIHPINPFIPSLNHQPQLEELSASRIPYPSIFNDKSVTPGGFRLFQ